MSLFLKLRRKIKENKFLFALLSPFVGLNRFIFQYYLKNKRFKNNGEMVLLNAHNALNSINLQHWLDFGTLLGVFRNGALLPNDLDIDLGVFLKDYSPDIEKAMIDYGFVLIHEYEIDGKRYGLEQSYQYKGVKVDLFYYNSNKDYIFTHIFMNFPGMTYNESIKIKGGLLPIENYFPKTGFTQVKFLNTYFTIPSPPEKYLAFHYGEDFMTPRKWDYMDIEKDNKNARYLTDKIGKINIHHP